MNWERDIAKHLAICELLLQRQKRKSFLHRIVTVMKNGDEKWIRYDNPKHKKLWVPTIYYQHLMPKDIHAVHLVRSSWCNMNCCKWVKPSVLNATNVNYTIWIEHSKKNACNMLKDMTKLFFFMTTRSHVVESVKEILEAFEWDVTCFIHQTLLLQITIYFSQCSMIFLSSTSVISKILKNDWIALKKTWIFLLRNSFVTRKVRKDYSFRWTIL